MELNRAVKLINEAKASLKIDGQSVTPQLETLAALFLLNVNSFDENMARAGQTPAQKNTAALFFRLLELKRPSPAVKLDIDFLCFIHKNLYMDFKPDCGTLRKTNIERSNSACMDYKMLPLSLKSVMDQLRTLSPGNPVPPKSDFAASLAHFMREFLIISPFLYGNGPAIRYFFEAYSYENGFILSFHKCPAKEFKDAENAVLLFDDVQPLFKCLFKCLTYRRPSPYKNSVTPVPKQLTRSKNPAAKRPNEKPRIIKHSARKA